jgi:hypothetical protein
MQYVTLVNSKGKAESRSHIYEPQYGGGNTIWGKCGFRVSAYDPRAKLSDAPGRKGICKLCERKAK